MARSLANPVIHRFSSRRPTLEPSAAAVVPPAAPPCPGQSPQRNCARPGRRRHLVAQRRRAGPRSRRTSRPPKREPSLAEIETIAQTWSEHCKHKTFTGPIRYTEGKKTRLIKNLFIGDDRLATKKLKKPWCLSVFKDNAGVVAFGKKWALAFKVETHNHPCAVEPYGGAATGVGGVVRDILGAGLGAKPVLNTDAFCFGRPDYNGALPEGAHHPTDLARRGGRRARLRQPHGHPHRRRRHLVRRRVPPQPPGVLRHRRHHARLGRQERGQARRPDRRRRRPHGPRRPARRHLLLGQPRRGRALRPRVQIGHAIHEKRVWTPCSSRATEKLYRSRDRLRRGRLLLGHRRAGPAAARACASRRPQLKVSDLEPWEIWLSESQERMVFAVPPKNLKAFEAFRRRGLRDSPVPGRVHQDRPPRRSIQTRTIVDLDMKFLHKGLPAVEREAVWTHAPARPRSLRSAARLAPEALSELMLAHLNVCSREWIIRQYDHEVQGGTVIKPLQGVRHDGPGDACVIWPHAATGDMEDFSGLRRRPRASTRPTARSTPTGWPWPASTRPCAT